MESRSAVSRATTSPSVVDVDWYVEDDQPKITVLLDREKAALNGITDQDAARALRLASAGDSAGLIHAPDEKEDVPIVVQAGGDYGDGIDGLLGMSFLSRFNINIDAKAVRISPRTAR